MQEPKSSGISKNPNHTLFLFKPRQVILAEQISGTKMAKKDQNQTTNDPSSDRKTLLIHSMLRYLETIGFSKTLKRLLSEAQVQDDNWRTSAVDLEDICCKYLETCDNVDTKSNTSKEQESRTNGFIKKDEESDHVASKKTISKKKKRNIGDSEDKLANDIVAELEVKPKEKKKSKRVSDSDGQIEQTSPEALTKPADDTVSELQVDESNKKHKDKKKRKKSTLNSESVDGNLENQQIEPLQGVTEDKSKDFVSSEVDGKSDREEKAKSKDKKKKNKEAITDTLVTEERNVESKGEKRKKAVSVSGDVAELVDKENPVSDSMKEILQASEDVTNKENKGSKKRKRLDSKENEHQSVEEVEIEDSKRQKTENLGETKIAAEPANEKLEKNGEEKSALRKSRRKQLNGSAELKTVNAFQRVKIDDVEFANEKLQDNSYWAKGGAEVGYGAKAQEILGQVKGRDFRHEKTKKKRGSYRGGNIDLHSHSVKFDYSDED